MTFLCCLQPVQFIKDSIELHLPSVCVPHWIKEHLKCVDQVCGHQDAIIPATEKTLWKKIPANCKNEIMAYTKLVDDIARPLVPIFYKEVKLKTGNFLEIENLCYHFRNPAIMDIKMGTRTFLENEVTNPSRRKDLYAKMIEIDPSEPTSEEVKEKAITKLRYMQFRERESTSTTLGFRIDAVKAPGKCPHKDFKRINSRAQVLEIMDSFLPSNPELRDQLNRRLRQIRDIIQESPLFQSHEVIGSSLLIIYDDFHIGAWIIDFAKFVPLPDNILIDHRSKWDLGNHEDGYLFGLDRLIEVVEDVNSRTLSCTSHINTRRENTATNEAH